MERTPVQSSNIVSVGYDSSVETLEVEFKSGAVYQYFNVPTLLYEQLMCAPSVGAFFNANVRNCFAYSQA
jgi:KTSC domain